MHFPLILFVGIDKEDLDLRDLTNPKEVRILVKYVQNLKAQLREQRHLNKKLVLQIEDIKQDIGKNVKVIGAPKHFHSGYKEEMTHYLEDHFLHRDKNEGDERDHDETKVDKQAEVKEQEAPEQQNVWNWW